METAIPIMTTSTTTLEGPPDQQRASPTNDSTSVRNHAYDESQSDFDDEAMDPPTTGWCDGEVRNRQVCIVLSVIFFLVVVAVVASCEIQSGLRRAALERELAENEADMARLESKAQAARSKAQASRRALDALSGRPSYLQSSSGNPWFSDFVVGGVGTGRWGGPLAKAKLTPSGKLRFPHAVTDGVVIKKGDSERWIFQQLGGSDLKDGVEIFSDGASSTSSPTSWPGNIIRPLLFAENADGRSALQNFARKAVLDKTSPEFEAQMLPKISVDYEIIGGRGLRFGVYELASGGDLSMKHGAVGAALRVRDVTGRRANFLSEAAVCELLRGILQGVQQLAAKGVVHSDIKPTNVVIMDPLALQQIGGGQQGIVGQNFFDFQNQGSVASQIKLIDLEFARRAHADGVFGYTKFFAAPEVSFDVPVSPTMDVWGVGVIGLLLFGSTISEGYDPGDKSFCPFEWASHARLRWWSFSSGREWYEVYDPIVKGRNRSNRTLVPNEDAWEGFVDQLIGDLESHRGKPLSGRMKNFLKLALQSESRRPDPDAMLRAL